jgi:hypothetical protein
MEKIWDVVMAVTDVAQAALILWVVIELRALRKRVDGE